jgi:hypothetical protein
LSVRPRLAPPRLDPPTDHWHVPRFASVASSLIGTGDRRLEAESYLSAGYAVRGAIEAQPDGWKPLETMAQIWLPGRLKAIIVSPAFGVPFLAATQVLDIRPTPRKWLSLERTSESADRYVAPGQILVTRSGAVGRSTIAYGPHLATIISDDLLRIDPREARLWGWIYAYLRASTIIAMMTSAQYGHVIKHLEVSHLNALPVPTISDRLIQHFETQAMEVLRLRQKAYELATEAERLFADTIGHSPGEDAPFTFTAKASELHTGRRRMEGCYHAPTPASILSAFEESGHKTEPLLSLTEGVWWRSPFRRVFGDAGVPYKSAEEIFALNAPVKKRVLLEQTKEPDQYFVKSGWLVMACSGQVYGLIGSVALMTADDEHTFFSHDLIRILPRSGKIRPGYLMTALNHPTLGRPLIVRYAYGTSIPHLEPDDIATMPIVRLETSIEEKIADLMEESASFRSRADVIENAIADEAERLIQRFMATGKTDAPTEPTAV